MMKKGNGEATNTFNLKGKGLAVMSGGDEVRLVRTYKEQGLDLSKGTNRKAPQVSVLPPQLFHRIGLSRQLKVISSKGVTDLITDLRSVDRRNLEGYGTTTNDLKIVSDCL